MEHFILRLLALIGLDYLSKGPEVRPDQKEIMFNQFGAIFQLPCNERQKAFDRLYKSHGESYKKYLWNLFMQTRDYFDNPNVSWTRICKILAEHDPEFAKMKSRIEYIASVERTTLQEKDEAAEREIAELRGKSQAIEREVEEVRKNK